MFARAHVYTCEQRHLWIDDFPFDKLRISDDLRFPDVSGGAISQFRRCKEGLGGISQFRRHGEEEGGIS